MNTTNNRWPARSAVETNEATGRTVFETLSVENDVEWDADTFAVEAEGETPD